PTRSLSGAGPHRALRPFPTRRSSDLSSADSGTGGHNVVWTADTGAPPVFAGSAQITGWTRMSANSPIFVAQAPAGLKTRQLYVKDRKSTRLNSSHLGISYAVFCLKKK